jgi:hypothetical protein
MYKLALPKFWLIWKGNWSSRFLFPRYRPCQQVSLFLVECAEGKCTVVLERNDFACLTTIKGMALNWHFYAVRASSWYAS